MAMKTYLEDEMIAPKNEILERSKTLNICRR